MPDTPKLLARLNRFFGPEGPRFFPLFLFLLGYLIVYPFAEDTGTGTGYYLFRVFSASVLLLSVYAVSFRRTFFLFALVLLVPSIIHHLFTSEGDGSAFAIVNSVLSFVFDGFVIVIIFRKVFLRGKVTTEIIYGALCIYLMIGFGFTSLYRMVSDLQANSFYLDPKTNLHTLPNRFDFIYYSFGTMTSLGAAGITPVKPLARAISVIEAILGILYLAVLISRLISNYREPSTVD
jgi:hypothetical protein